MTVKKAGGLQLISTFCDICEINRETDQKTESCNIQSCLLRGNCPGYTLQGMNLHNHIQEEKI